MHKPPSPSVLLLLVLTALAFVYTQNPCTIKVGLTTVTGTYDEKFRVCSYKNLKFGADTSKTRWQSPEKSETFFLDKISTPLSLDNTKFGLSCPQVCGLPKGLCPEEGTLSEDCLNLNVYAPAEAKNSELPVVVFIPGGHFDMGTANCAAYDGVRFVGQSNQVILVVVNYRLGSLGFMADVGRNITGNFGVRDQRLALEWVQYNIGFFGGNKNLVTLSGESAGAASVATQLVSPMSRGLFQKAIMMSAPLALPFRTAESNTKLSNFFAEAAGCKHDKTTDCIKALSFQDVIKYQGIADSKFILTEPIVTFMPWTPTLNQFELPDQPLDAFQKGNYQRMPIMMGSCREEAIMFVYLALSKSMSLLEYEGALAGLFFGYFKRVNKMYPPAHADKREDLSMLGTDFIFTAPIRNASKSIDKYNKASNAGDVFLYEFNHAAEADVWGEKYNFCKGRVCHGIDVPFFFDSIAASGASWTTYEEYLTYLFKFYVTNFATTGNPNSGPSPCKAMANKSVVPCQNDNSVLEWNAFNATSLMNLQMDPTQTYMGKELRKVLLDQWDYMGYAFGRKI